MGLADFAWPSADASRHGSETATVGFHVNPGGGPLSDYMVGVTVIDRFDGTSRRFSELDRRRELMMDVVCGAALQ